MRTWNRKELKEKAKFRLKSNYWKAVLVGLLALSIGGGSPATSGVSSVVNTSDSSGMALDPFAGSFSGSISGASAAMLLAGAAFILAFLLIIIAVLCVAQIVLLNPLGVGCCRFFYLNLKENADIKEVCYAFDRGYKNSVKVMFFKNLYTLLWTLLFIVPGIMKSYEYRMIPYLLSENPNMSKEEAFARSKQMMAGNMWDAFVLDLSFILWDMLSACTFGILHVFYVGPYKRMTDAGLYQALKGRPVMGWQQTAQGDGTFNGSSRPLDHESET